MQIHRKNTSSLIDNLIVWYGFLLLIMSATIPGTHSKPVCYGDVDIVFVIDSSYSIKDPQFDQVRKFVEDIYLNIYGDIGEKIRIAAIPYATRVYKDYILTLNTNHKELVPHLNAFPRDVENVGTDTAEALYWTIDLIADGPAKPQNIPVECIVLLITDGQSDDTQATLAAAKALKAVKDITVVAVGLGDDDLDTAELQGISSDPEGFHITENLNDHDFVKNTLKTICAATQGQKPKSNVKKDAVALDVIFIMDESGSALKQDFEIAKEFIMDIMETFKISDKMAKVGIVKYGKGTIADAVHMIPLGSYNTEKDLFAAIDELYQNPFNRDGHDVVGAFETVNNIININADQARPVAVVLFTGKMMDRSALAIEKAKEIKNQAKTNVEILVLGIGDINQEWDAERNRLASNLKSSFYMKNYEAIAGNDDESKERIAVIRDYIYRIGTGNTGAVKRWDKSFDIVFTIDGSKLMQSDELNAVKFVLNELINGFKLDPSVSSSSGRVAVLMYDGIGVYDSIMFNDYTDRAGLLQRINGLKLLQRTDTANNAYALSVASAYSQESKRENAAQIIFMMTKSPLGDDLPLAEAEASIAANQGIQLFTLGMGTDVTYDELENLQMYDVINPPSYHMETLSLGSSTFVQKLKDQLEHYAGVYRPNGNIIPQKEQVDLIVAVHDEGARADGGKAIKYKLQEIISSYEFGNKAAWLGMFTFGANLNTDQVIPLEGNNVPAQLLIAAYNLKLTPSGGPDLEKAFSGIIDMASKGRPGVPKVAILMLEAGDMKIKGQNSNIAKAARDQGIKTIAIGVGGEVQRQFPDLRMWTFNPQAVFMQQSWNVISWSPAIRAAITALATDTFPPQGIERLPDQCKQDAGIIFVIESSVFDKTKNFATTLMNWLKMPVFQIGGIRYQKLNKASDPVKVINPGEILNYFQLYTQFMKLPPSGFKNELSDMFVGTTPNSSPKEKIVFLIVDGSAIPNEIKNKARNAIKAGLVVIVVNLQLNGAGVTAAIQNELTTLTDRSELVFSFKEAELQSYVVLSYIQRLICRLALPGDCLAGSFRDPDTLVCSACQLGFYQNLNEQLFCFSCQTGYTTEKINSNSMGDCRMDCPPGTKSEQGTCKLCPFNTFQPANAQDNCITCPDKKITDRQGAASVEDCKEDKCTLIMDLVLIVDCTGSISDFNFQLLQVFLINLLSKFNIGLDATRIAIVEIRSETSLGDYTRLSESYNAAVLTKRIVSLQGGANTTNTASALAMATKVLEDEGRKKVAKMMLVVTDGISAEPFRTLYHAVQAKQQGNTIMAMGIGEIYYEAELLGIASDPSYVLKEKDFMKLQNLGVSKLICDAAKAYKDPVKVDYNGKCNESMDLIIVIDSSESMDDQLLTLQVKLIELLGKLVISDKKMRVGTISFASEVNLKQVAPLSGNMQTVTNGILQQSRGKGTATNTTAALIKVRMMLASSKRAKAMLLVTDGQSTNATSTRNQAAEVKNAGIFSVAVGIFRDRIDQSFVDELKAIGTTGSDSTTFVKLASKITADLLRDKICPVTFSCSYNLDVAYIWDYTDDPSMLDKRARFTTDLSKRFANTKAIIIAVRRGTNVPTILKAFTVASNSLANTGRFGTIHHIVMLTARAPDEITESLTDLQRATTSIKQTGVKITIVYGANKPKTLWESYASNTTTVFNGTDFFTRIPMWFIQRSICQEPCKSGREIKQIGTCGDCGKGRYRNKEESYTCKACPVGTTTNGTDATSYQKCIIDKCDVPVDMVFVIDGSDSIGISNFGLLKSFFWKLLDRFNIGLGENQTRVALVMIGTTITNAHWTSFKNSINDYYVKVDLFRFEGGERSTNTGAAIARAIQTFEEGGRENTPKFIVLATDGRSTSALQTIHYGVQARIKDIHVIAIAIGDLIYMSEINAVATNPEDVFVFGSFIDLFNSASIHRHLCEVAIKFVPKNPKPDPSDLLLGDCKTNMDVVFLIDSSVSISEKTYFDMKLFLGNFFYNRIRDVGLSKTRIAIIAYSYDVHEEDIFSLSQSVDLLALNKGMQYQKQKLKAGTATAAAISRGTKMFAEQGRAASPFVMMVITDGKSDKRAKTIAAAHEARDKGIHVAVVAVGTYNEVFKEEVYDIATAPSSVKCVDSFDLLNEDDLLNLSCAYDFMCKEPMDIMMIWDLENVGTITRANLFNLDLKSSFKNSRIEKEFVDHVPNVAEAAKESVAKLKTRTNTKVVRVVAIITDKKLTQTVTEKLNVHLNDAKKNGIIVTFIDTNMNSHELRVEVSNEKQFHHTEKFDMLPYNLIIKKSLCITESCLVRWNLAGFQYHPAGSERQACPAGTEVSHTGDKCDVCGENTYRDPTESFMCTPCKPPLHTNKKVGSTHVSHCILGNCLQPMDIVFAVDASLSILGYQFALMKLALMNIVSYFDVGENHTMFGIVPFSNEVVSDQVLYLNTSNDKSTIFNFIDGLRQPSESGTGTAKAIFHSQNVIETGRSEVFKVIMILTDGNPNNPYRTREAARNAREQFNRVVTVSIGTNVQLEEINSLSNEQSSFLFPTFLDLAKDKTLAKNICEDTFTCSKNVKITLLVDNIDGTSLVAAARDFQTQLDESYNQVTEIHYTSLAALRTEIQLILPIKETKKTLLFVVITRSHIIDPDTKDMVNSLRVAGGIVSVINVNNLENRQFYGIVSNKDLLFKTDKFNKMPWYRYIEREFCKAPCGDGHERQMDGSCGKCKAGTYRAASQSHTCVKCSEGKTTASEGVTLSSFCIPNCRAGTKTVDDDCIDCDRGTYQEDEFQEECVPCPSGFTTMNVKSISASECLADCKAGTMLSADRKSCEDCPINTYQDKALQSQCLKCPTNLKTKGTKSVSITECKDACQTPMDVILLIDASTSISRAEFNLVKGFCANVVYRFSISGSDTRLGLISFASEVLTDPRFNLKDSLSRDAAVKACLTLIQGTEHGTDTAGAFKEGIKMFADQGRRNVQKVLVVLTDGIPSDPSLTRTQALRAKRLLIDVKSIGVGDSVDMKELEAIATTEDERSVKVATNFVQLLQINILPFICHPEARVDACSEPMVISISKQFAGDSSLESKFQKFTATLKVRYKNENLQILNGNSLVKDLTTVLEGSDEIPGYAHMMIIVTNDKAENIDNVLSVSNAVRQKGVMIAVIYADDAMTDRSYDKVVSDESFIYYQNNFHIFPFNDLILRSLCKVSCKDGNERNENGRCSLCEKGSYRTASQSHMCIQCPDSTTTAGTGTVSGDECVKSVCSDSQWQCKGKRGLCIDKTLRCDRKFDCQRGDQSDKSDEEICPEFCVAGQRFDSGEMKCVDCGQGFYQPKDGQTTCFQCPEDSTTPSGTRYKTEEDCSVTCDTSGYELIFPNGDCKKCEIGYFRDKDLHTKCIPCGEKQTTNMEGSISSSACVWSCSKGYKWDDKQYNCVVCPEHTYQPENNQEHCIPCPHGTKTEGTGKKSKDSCIIPPCGKGKYLNDDRTSCKPCEPGTFRSDITEALCTKCKSGLISDAGATSESNCKPPCDKGKYWVNGRCENCPFGTYQDEMNQYQCKKCKDGTSTNEQGNIDESKCIVPCPLGYILRRNECHMCAVGFFRELVTEVACTKCDSGFTTKGRGADSKQKCIYNCLPGTYIGADGKSCIPCSIGQYQSKRLATSCELCQSHLSTAEKGADDEALCINPCPSGKELTSQNPIICKLCKKNTYRDEAVDKKCTVCKNNFITLADGTISSKLCMPPCGMGQRWDIRQCVDCEKNTFQSLPGQYTCIKCPKNYITLERKSKYFADCKVSCKAGEEWVKEKCVPCRPGTYQPSPYQMECLICPSGTSNSPDYTECTDPCGSGKYLPLGGTLSTDCINCPYNTYKKQSSTSCVPCRDNFITKFEGSKKDSDCVAPVCGSNQYQCRSNKCISLSLLCDLADDCEDGSDEDKKLCPNCGAGRFHDGSKCELCPRGTYNPESFKKELSCKLCRRGTTTLATGAETISDCRDICPSGETLVYEVGSSTSIKCGKCPAKTFKPAVTSNPECQNCESGFSSIAGSVACVPDCPPGTYHDTSTVKTCKLCAKGTYQYKSLQTSCNACSKGRTTRGEGSKSSQLCYDPCPGGYEFDDKKLPPQCSICSEGSYREQNVHPDCQNCEARHTTVKPGAATKQLCVPNCGSGSYFRVDVDPPVCTSCPSGTYQPLPHQYSCKYCPKGTSSRAGSKSLDSCSENCGDGKELAADGSCVACPKGQIKVAPQTSCQECPDGFTTVDEGDVECVSNCAAGSFRDVSGCRPCPAGTYQPKPYQNKCLPCDIGTYTMDEGASKKAECVDKCPSGFELLPNGSCIECKKNYYRDKTKTNPKQMVCVSCPLNTITALEGSISIDDCFSLCQEGTFLKNEDTVDCELCSVGEYQDMKHQKSCKKCLPQQTTIDLKNNLPTAGATSKEQCVGNCTEGEKWNEKDKKCDLCPNGEYQEQKFKKSCSSCTPGYTSPKGAKSMAQCYDPCESGRTLDKTSGLCVPCGYKKYRNRLQHNLCEKCDKGLITFTITAKDISDCKFPCLKGRAWNLDLEVCVECEIGYYQPATNSDMCIKCPNNWITPLRGSDSVDDCVPWCIEGEQWDYSSDSCMYCPIGTYQDEKNKIACKQCPDGKTTKSEQSTKETDCNSCMKDFWLCGNGDCGKRCDDTTDCSDGTDEYGCDCQPGTIAVLTAQNKCIDCPKGTYQRKTGKTFCTPCPAGTTTDGDGSSREDDCKECNDGTEFVGGSCVACKKGTYRKKGTTKTCQACPNYFTTDFVAGDDAGAVSVSECIPECSAGTFMDISGTCKECPRGYYQEKDHQYECIKCGLGKTTPGVKSTEMSYCYDPCGDGYALPLSGTDKSECSLCPVGMYKKSSESSYCRSCQQGYSTNTAGAKDGSACLRDCNPGEKIDKLGTGCEPCEMGSYQDMRGQEQCILCADGKTTQFEGSDDSKDCEDLCNDGLELTPDKMSCRPCKKGENRARYGEAECKPCKKGYTTVTIGASSQGDCVRDCGPGYYINAALDCVLCEEGKYQDLAYQTKCKGCPAWKAFTKLGAKKASDCQDLCTNGYESLSGRCEPCERGKFREAGKQEKCEQCAPGFTTEVIAKHTKDDCVPDCTQGQRWDNVSGQCVSCDPGYYNPNPYKLNCSKCPGDTPLSEADFLSCKAICQAGASWNRALKRCNWCKIGEYNGGTDQTKSCQKCEAGKTTLKIGASSKNECVKECAPGEERRNGKDCKSCDVGYFKPKAGEYKCKKCDTGKLSTDDKTGCKDNCKAGSYWNGASCEKCSKTAYQDMEGKEECIRCPDDKHTKNTGSTNVTQCQADWCDPGFKYILATDKCVPCLTGFYRGKDDRECIKCLINKTTYAVPADGPNKCLDVCAAGFIFNIKTSKCEDISVGCDGGFVLNEVTNACEPCGFGSYRRKFGDEKCMKCPVGETTTTNKATSPTDCQKDPCRSGKEWIDGRCVPCRKGWYKNIRLHTRCQSCSYGYSTRKVCAPDQRYCYAVPCSACQDIVIVVDMSNSINSGQCGLLKRYIKNLLKRFTIHPRKIRIGVIKYSEGTYSVIDLRRGYSYRNICYKISRKLVPSRSSQVNTAGALQRAREMLMFQGRTGKDRHVLLITDEPSSNPAAVAQQASMLKSDGVKVTAIGVNTAEVNSIGSSEEGRFVISGFNDLPSENGVFKSLCPKL